MAFFPQSPGSPSPSPGASNYPTSWGQDPWSAYYAAEKRSSEEAAQREGSASKIRARSGRTDIEQQEWDQNIADTARARSQGIFGMDQSQRLQREQWDAQQRELTQQQGLRGQQWNLQSRLGESQLAGQTQQQALRGQFAGLYSNALTGLMSGFNVGGGGGGGSPYTPPGGGGGAPVSYGGAPSVAPINSAASVAQSAQFGQAKGRAGAMGRSALESLRSELADRNMLGSGAEAQGTVDLLAKATNPLSDLNVAQLGENVGIAQHNQDLQARGAETAFQGGIAQRGQDIAQRGQDIQAGQFAAELAQRKREQQQQIISSALSGLTRMF